MAEMVKKSTGKCYLEKAPHDFGELLEIVAILRDRDEGCPWDSVQTPESLKSCLANETDEVLAAIDSGDHGNLLEELGDVLFQVLLISRIASERGWFGFDDVVQTISEKMIRRHPFVFTDEERDPDVDGAELWRRIKEREKYL